MADLADLAAAVGLGGDLWVPKCVLNARRT
jgi:hypothetical protein